MVGSDTARLGWKSLISTNAPAYFSKNEIQFNVGRPGGHFGFVVVLVPVRNVLVSTFKNLFPSSLFGQSVYCLAEQKSEHQSDECVLSHSIALLLWDLITVSSFTLLIPSLNQGILKGDCTVDLLFDWFGISCMTTDNFCFYLQSRPIQTSQTRGQWYSDTFPFSIPCLNL
jgi:hypothetical protein